MKTTYVVKFGKYYLDSFYTKEDKPSLNFISDIELNIKKDRAFKFEDKVEADYMVDKLCENLEIFEDKTSFKVEEYIISEEEEE